MKLVTFLMVVACLQVNGKGVAQNVTINERNTSLKVIFNKIHKQTGISFFYRDEWLSQAGKVTVQVKDKPLSDVLDICFENQPLTYELMGKTILVKLKPAASVYELFMRDKELRPEIIPIQGIVADNTGKSLDGVSVVVRGTNKGTSTDTDGRFTIDANPGDVLVFSRVGYKSVSHTVGTSTSIRVTMEIEEKEGDEVVVIGYGTATRKTATDAITRIDSTVLKENVSASLIEIIQGQVPGMMTLMGSGAPGEEPLAILRGVATLEGNLQPLIVIDDIPMNENFSFNEINPNDILSIDILKGASASSIYGSRGAGGVFMITTKNGLNSPPRVDYRFNYGKTTLTKSLDVLNTDEFKMLFVESMMNRANDENVVGRGAINDGILNYGTNYQDYIVNAYWGNAETDWMSLLYQPSKINNHNVSITGQGAGVGYSVGLGYTDNQGIIRKSGYKRYTLDLKMESRQSRFIQYGINVRGTAQNQENQLASLSNVLLMRPDMPAYNDDGTLFIPPLGTNNYTNPLVNLEGVDGGTGNIGYQLGGFTQFNISKSLTWKTLASLYNSNSENEKYYNSTTSVESNNYSVTAPLTGSLTRNSTKNNNYEVDSRLNYKTRIAERHKIDAVAAVNFERTSFYTEGLRFSNFPNDYLTAPWQAINYYKPTGSAWNASLVSFVFRTNYSFDDRYLLTLSMRRDGTSRMAPDVRYANFPSLAFAWNAGDLDWVKNNLSFIRMLKPRFSIGKLANASVPPYGWLTTFTDAASDGQPGLIPFQIPNDELQWETTTQYDIGLDFSLFKQRNLYGSLNYYHKTTIGVLQAYDFPLSSGLVVNSTMVNIGDIENKGIEFDINWNLVQSKDWVWRLSANVAHNTNKLLKLNKDITRNSTYDNTILKEGEPIGLLYGYKTKGIFQSWEEVSYYNGQNPGFDYQPLHMAVGEVKFVDLNGNGYIDYYEVDDERTVLGHSYPTVYGGFSTFLRYKSFSLAVQASYSLGASKNWNVMYDQFKFLKTNPRNLLKLNLDRWTADQPSDIYPKMMFDPVNGSTGFSRYTALYFTDQWIYKTDYIRINNLKVNYSVDKKILAKNRILNAISGLEAGISINNLITFTKYPGINPEGFSITNRIAGPGNDNSVYPQSRTLNVIFNITF